MYSMLENRPVPGPPADPGVSRHTAPDSAPTDPRGSEVAIRRESAATVEPGVYRGRMDFSDPQAILFVADCERAAAFYAAFGFQETFRGPATDPVKIELTLGGFCLGLALAGPAAESHGLTPVISGHRACITLWTDDVDAAHALALEAGAVDLRRPHPFLDGRLRVAFVEDPDGHPVQLVQKAA